MFINTQHDYILPTIYILYLQLIIIIFIK